MQRLNWTGLFVFAACLVLLFSGASPVRGDEIAEALQARIDARIVEIKAWAANPTIVEAVKARNSAGPGAYKDMTQDKWKALSVLDPEVRKFTKNQVALFIKSKKDTAVAEAFVSCADGTKVGFLTKTTFWNHSGKDKHDQPMKGRTWRGPLEVDESTGVQQIQIAVPVLDEGKPIGSLVVGLELTRLQD